MVSTVLASGGSKKRLLSLGSTYIFAVFFAYLLAGFGLLYFLSEIPLFVTEYLSITVGSLIIIAGILKVLT